MAELREWLEARGLGRYADALLAQDIELDILPQLTDADLTAAGLPVGARKRLLVPASACSRRLRDCAGSPTQRCCRSFRQRSQQLKRNDGN